MNATSGVKHEELPRALYSYTDRTLVVVASHEIDSATDLHPRSERATDAYPRASGTNRTSKTEAESGNMRNSGNNGKQSKTKNETAEN